MSGFRKHWPQLICSVLLLVVACNPAVEDDGLVIEVDTSAENGETPLVAGRLTPTPLPTFTPPPEPTPLPTAEPDAWLQIGNNATGLQLAIPPEWVNLSASFDTATAANPLGLTVLLTTDSARTGERLLAGKGVGTGAFATGIISNLMLESEIPTEGLQEIVGQFLPNKTAVSSPLPLRSMPLNNVPSVNGAFVDVEGTAVIFPDSTQVTMRTRIAFFPLPTPAPDMDPIQAIYMFTAEASTWAQYEDTFLQMMDSIIVHNLYQDIVINDGRANVLGSLGEQDVANGRLEAGVHDLWTFTTNNGRYATITLSADNKDIDLTFSLIGPTGQTLERVDNGFAGDTELLIDWVIAESGTYVIEISEFFGEPGPYTLSLVLTDDPLFSDGGSIDIGQTIQSELPAGGQKVWLFDALAGQTVSVVLIPESPFDAILELYGPDGSLLVGLDEGFSGDAEVIAGYDLPLTGEYTIVIRSFAGDGGPYSLSLDEGGEDTLNFFDAGDLIYGATERQTLQTNEAHAWFFIGKAGDAIIVDVIPITPSLDLDVWLLDPDVERLQTQDLFLAGEAERIEQTLDRDGQYIVLVSDFFGESGEYEIKLTANQAAAPQEAGTLTIGEPVNGQLQADQPVIWYFEGEVGDVLDITLTTANDERDIAFDVVGPDGIRVRSIDEATNGQPEQLTMFTLMANGRWGIVVSEFFGDSVAYELRVER